MSPIFNAPQSVTSLDGTIGSTQGHTPMPKVFIETLSTGYRRAFLLGSCLIVRPDGSEAWTNVQQDSPIYMAMNTALFGASNV